MTFKPTIIKPTRTHTKAPSLDFSRAASNARKGIETSIVLDLNILSKMNDVVVKKTTYSASGLESLVKFINKLPLVLSPGFALNEADKSYIETLWDSWEMFLWEYCPTYVDTPNATKNKVNQGSERRFELLSRTEQHFFSISYLAILTISVIAGDANLTPEGKFEKYVEYMSTNADMLSAIESEVARYCFFDRTHEKNIAFKNFSEVIRDNFIKGGKAEKKLMKALNPARDIMYYRAVAMQSSRALDGKVQDTWLVTADDGLKNLSQSIYFLPGFDGSDSKAVKFVRNQSQKQSSYWRYCDALFEDTVIRRMGRQSSDQCDSDDKKQFQRLFDCIAEQEGRLRIASI